MSMYVQFLEAALAERGDSAPPTAPAALAEVRRRQLLIADATHLQGGGHDASAALADQLAYDLALMALARSVTIECRPSDFDQPQQRRQQLERELEAKGIPLTNENAESDMAR